MKMLILNCDLDENPATNGAELINNHLAKIGVYNVVIKNCFEYKFPSEEDLPTFSGIIITGSCASVYENRGWIRNLMELIRKIDSLDIPTLGICFGFQIVAQALGGNVERSSIFEEGYTHVRLTQNGSSEFLFDGFPKEFKAYQSHGDVARFLPESAILLAYNEKCLQAYSIRKFSCVQFHPEILPKTAVEMANRDDKDISLILNSVDHRYMLPLNIIINFIYYCR